ncbi:unnamed protein product [Caenorhabditis nigoni]
MILVALVLFPIFSAIEIIRIKDDHNCTEWNPNGFVYSWQAVACQDVAVESYCKWRYPSMVYPAIGGGENRPMQCYSSPSTPPGTIDQDAKGAAIAGCPRTCGYCCQTHAFSCQDKNENMACWTVTQAQCISPKWRDFFTEECPATCGYCDDCYDLNPECPKAPGVCTNLLMQDYVNVFCQRTCNRFYKDFSIY